uniref:Uncharacterized protein LOC102808824 n=1 Tax=Saccoglossus kowalevskii TaxID=10224 RepID=A0ABM0M0Z6_SACKO|nr:PREDICTED: uncharacterized protein LOC102808824 [Saccoglossus kowalevskii]
MAIFILHSGFSLAFYCKNDINTVEECNSEDSEDESETSSDSENGCDSYDYARTTTTSTIQHHTSKVEIKEEVISDEDNSTHEKDKRNNIVEEDAGDEDNGRHEKDKHNNIIDEDAGDEDNGRHEKDKHNNNIDEDAGDEDNGTHEKDKHNKLVNIIDEDESDESSSHSISIFAESPSTLIEKTVQSGDISPDTVGTSSLETPDKVSSAKSPSTEETPESSYNTVDMMKISRSATFSEARLNTAMPPENTEPSSNAAIICGFCKNGEDIKKYGKLIMHEKDSAHYLCMFNSSGLGLEVSPYSEKFVNFGEGFDANKVRQEMRRGRKLFNSSGLGLEVSPYSEKFVNFGEGFDANKVRQEMRRGRKLRCRYKECGKTGATVGCEVKHCKATYHYHCAKLDNGHYKFIRDAPNLQYRRTLFCKNHCCESEDESELDSSMSLSQHSLTQQQEHVPWEQSYKQQYDEPQLLNCDPLPDQGSLLPDHGSQLTEYESDLKQLKSQLPDDEILLNNKAQSKDSVPQLSDHHLHLLTTNQIYQTMSHNYQTMPYNHWTMNQNYETMSCN